jgi:hypothetical protein
MKIRWCAPSGGGCSEAGVSDVVSAATHDVHPGCTGLMAGPAFEHVVLEFPTLNL